MKTISQWTIRNSFIVIVLCSMIPAFGVILTYGFLDYRRSACQVWDQAASLAKSLTAQQEQLTGNTKLLLKTISRFDAVKNYDIPKTENLFKQLQAENPIYANFLLIDLNGLQVASSVPPPGQVILSDRKYFKESVQNQRFSAGEWVMGRTLMTPAIHFAAPVFDEANSLIGVLATAVPLDKYDSLLSQVSLPSGSRVITIDHQGKR
ncbi:MAG: cache domain-containing protein, partial [Deltaproteobacteria bacterium]|nr:cache domain-containing protein [Deltaproteobacteria bacterium]